LGAFCDHSPRRTTQGARTSKAKKAEMGLGGSFVSGRKVCCISGRGWKEASSGWTGAGNGGTERSKRSTDIGEYFGDPMIRVTWTGAVEVGGKDVGGLDMFSSNLAFPEAVTRTGWMPSSSDSVS